VLNDNQRTADVNEENTRVTDTMLYVALVCGAFLVVMLAGGLGMVGATAYKVGPYASYGCGLTMIAVSATLGVSAGALMGHRRILRDVANNRAMIRILRGEIAELHNELLSIREHAAREHRTIIAMEKEQVETLHDELGRRRLS
jgi:Ni/Fe-hydrogenase subunit HybB-like protein